MSERSSLAEQTEGQLRSKGPETYKDPITATSVTAILLELLAKYSSENNQEITYQQFEEAAHTFLTLDYSFDYTPYTIDYSYFRIDNYGDVDYLSVDIPAGLKVELENKLENFSRGLKDNQPNESWDKLQEQVENHRYHLEKSIISTMLALAYQNDWQSSQSSQIFGLIHQNRYSLN